MIIVHFRMDYKHGKIYQIWNDVTDKIYIGSTTQPLAKRFSVHRSKAKHKTNHPLYADMKEYGCQCFHIELIRDYPCDTKEQLHRKEGHYIRKYNTHRDGYNRQVAGRTHAEYREANHGKIAECHKAYREANKDSISKHKKAYYKANQGKILEHDKAYNVANRDKLNQKIPCPTCEKLINRHNLARHYKRKHPVEED